MSASVVSSAVGLLDRQYSPSPPKPDSPEPAVERQASWQNAPDDVDMQDAPSATGTTTAETHDLTQAQPRTNTDGVDIKRNADPVGGADDAADANTSAKTNANKNSEAKEDREDTIGGLLAALNNASPLMPTISNESAISMTAQITGPIEEAKQDTLDAPPLPVRKSASPPVESPISQLSQEEEPAAAQGRQNPKEGGAIATTEINHAHLPSLQQPDTFKTFSDAEAPLNTSMPLLDHSDLLPEPTLMDGIVPEISAEDIQAMHRYQQEHPMTLQDLEMHMANQSDPLMDEQAPGNIRRQYHAFARLEFPDGTFYLNTYQCELGRDQHAYQDAMRREAEDARIAAEEEQKQPKEWSGAASQRVQSIKAAESQIQRSVVSESGGFAGVDDKPVEAYGDKKGSAESKSRSQASDGSIVRPVDVLHNPFLAPYDYNKDAIYPAAPPADDEIYDGEQAAPVTDEHMPNPKSCPLIPIHPTPPSKDARFPPMTDAENMRNISRRHIRIEWDWKKEAWYMTVLGRNGAFFDDDWKPPGKRMKLFSGAKMQVSAVEITFRLPNQPEDSDDQDLESAVDIGDADMVDDIPASERNGRPVKLKLKLKTDSSPPAAVNGETKRRGPGRPPKNGVMSQREMKEREKAEKEAKARTSISNSVPNKEVAPTPSAQLQRKPSKSQLPKPELAPEPEQADVKKPEKRKREDGEEDEVVLPSIEPQDEMVVDSVQQQQQPPPPPSLPPNQPPTQTQTVPVAPMVAPPPAKRARTKSYSPPYKPYEECTAEDLARPPHNYAVLLYMVLQDTGEITLRRIYKEMQYRWPFFKYGVDSDGWTSSVRHNLNQEVGKLFERGRKEGKGFTWLPKPNAMAEYQATKQKRSNAPALSRPRPQPQRPNFPPTQGQQLTWQNTAPTPQANRPNGSAAPPGYQPANGARPPQMPAHGGQAGHPPGFGHPRLPLDPTFVPRDDEMHKFIGLPAPRFFPITFEGGAVLYRFECTMMKGVATTDEKRKLWSGIFQSVRRRALYGAKESTLEGGEIADERMIMQHFDNFIKQFKNERFAGFDAAPIAPGSVPPNQPQSVPAPNGASQTPQADKSSSGPSPAPAVGTSAPVGQPASASGPAGAITPAGDNAGTPSLPNKTNPTAPAAATEMQSVPSQTQPALNASTQPPPTQNASAPNALATSASVQQVQSHANQASASNGASSSIVDPLRSNQGTTDQHVTAPPPSVQASQPQSVATRESPARALPQNTPGSQPAIQSAAQPGPAAQQQAQSSVPAENPAVGETIAQLSQATQSDRLNLPPGQPQATKSPTILSPHGPQTATVPTSILVGNDASQPVSVPPATTFVSSTKPTQESSQSANSRAEPAGQNVSAGQSTGSSIQQQHSQSVPAQVTRPTGSVTQDTPSSQPSHQTQTELKTLTNVSQSPQQGVKPVTVPSANTRATKPTQSPTATAQNSTLSVGVALPVGSTQSNHPATSHKAVASPQSATAGEEAAHNQPKADMKSSAPASEDRDMTKARDIASDAGQSNAAALQAAQPSKVEEVDSSLPQDPGASTLSTADTTSATEVGSATLSEGKTGHDNGVVPDLMEDGIKGQERILVTETSPMHESVTNLQDPANAVLPKQTGNKGGAAGTSTTDDSAQP